MRINKPTMNINRSVNTAQGIFEYMRNAIKILTGKMTPVRYEAIVPDQFTRVTEKFDVVLRANKHLHH
jgi:hypothetical protein